jgi:glycosyltransferase involved in cell wall biosynthesis
VVPTYNEEKGIARCLAPLRKQGCEIIVADGYSKDRTIAIAKKYADRIIYSRKKGPAQGRNMGAKIARSRIVAFVDADTVVAPGWAGRVERDFRDGIIALGGVARPLGGGLLDELMFRINSDAWYRLSALFGFFQAATFNCAYDRRTFLKAGGFREDLPIGEDTELSMRIRRYGRVRIDGGLVAYNSVRRMRKEGYVRMFVKYVRAFGEMALGERVKAEHFRADFG